MSIGRPGILTGMACSAKAESKERPINANVPIEEPPQKPRTHIRTAHIFMKEIPIPKRLGIYDAPEADPDEIALTLHPAPKKLDI